MRLSDFDYKLDKSLIAQYPLKVRDNARLLVLHKKSGEIEHRVFSDLISYLISGDLIVLNDTRVQPARLFGRKSRTNGKVEILLLKRLSKDRWETLIKGRLGIGQEIIFKDGLIGRITGYREDGRREIEFRGRGSISEILQRIGKTPLPPYIIRRPEEIGDEDREMYQTVYARQEGSIAAPTAGLHFTKELLTKIEIKGVNIIFITLHIGAGTFQPVREDNIEMHRMEPEYFEIGRHSIDAIRMAINEGKRIIAVGTTTTRVIESVIKDIKNSHIGSIKGDTTLFIYPGYRFMGIDGLVTNLHLPKSTLFMLVSAFAGIELLKKAYEEAIKNRYRFYSYGDGMLILE